MAGSGAGASVRAPKSSIEGEATSVAEGACKLVVEPDNHPDKLDEVDSFHKHSVSWGGN